MKRMAWMAIGIALLLGVSGAAGQSLGDVARATRKSKARQNASARFFDNDNLPRDTHLSVVGPEPAADAKADANPSGDADKPAQPAQEPANASSGSEAKAPAPEAKAPSAASKTAADPLKDKIQAQRQKVDSLSKDLELTQREYRLRAVAMYSDAGNRLRNATQWDKEDAQYKKDIADKQQALDAARQDLKDMEDQARKEP